MAAKIPPNLHLGEIIAGKIHNAHASLPFVPAFPVFPKNVIPAHPAALPTPSPQTASGTTRLDIIPTKKAHCTLAIRSRLRRYKGSTCINLSMFDTHALKAGISLRHLCPLIMPVLKRKTATAPAGITAA